MSLAKVRSEALTIGFRFAVINYYTTYLAFKKFYNKPISDLELVLGLAGWGYQAYNISKIDNLEKAIKSYINIFIESFSPRVIEMFLLYPIETLMFIMGDENL